MSKSEQTVNAADLAWGNRYAKRYAEEMSFRTMANWARRVVNKNILSLPASEWLWERAFSALFPDGKVRFYGIDRDPAVYGRLADVGNKQLYPDHKLVPFGCRKFSELVTAYVPGNVQFDMIYLDWMGSWGNDKHTQIVRMFEKQMLAPDSMFKFTMALNRGHPKRWEDLVELEHSSFSIVDIRGGGGDIAEWRTQGVPALVETIGRDFGRKVKTVGVQVYYHYTQKRSTPMGSFLFKVD